MPTVAAGSRHSVSYTKESTFGTTPTAALRNIATVSAAAADDSYNDATEDLSVFKAGDLILVSGFSEAANNGLKHVVSATANKMIVEESLADDAAGDDVTIVIAFEEFRNTGTTLALAKDTFQSGEIRSDRQITDFRHGNKRVEGDLSFEFSADAFDLWLEALLQGTWASQGGDDSAVVLRRAALRGRRPDVPLRRRDGEHDDPQRADQRDGHRDVRARRAERRVAEPRDVGRAGRDR
jgi:hypothetical protein